MRYEIPQMVAQGGGVIVNMASILGAVGFATASAYVAAKHGLLGLTKVAALEYAQQGIRVNSVGPAFIKTPMVTDALDAATQSRSPGSMPWAAWESPRRWRRSRRFCAPTKRRS